MTSSRTPPRPRPMRAALIGLALGCGVGGLALLGTGALTLLNPRACADLECTMKEDVRRERAPSQLGFGGALCLLGIGLSLLRPDGPSDDE